MGFAADTLDTMFKSCSPISCKVTLRAIREFAAEEVTVGHVLQIEYRLAQRFTTRPQPESDFYEGIRAVLVDKDRKQKWSPGWDQLEQITNEKVAFYFSPLEPDHRRGELLLTSPAAFCEKERRPFPVEIRKAHLSKL